MHNRGLLQVLQVGCKEKKLKVNQHLLQGAHTTHQALVDRVAKDITAVDPPPLLQTWSFPDS